MLIILLPLSVSSVYEVLIVLIVLVPWCIYKFLGLG